VKRFPALLLAGALLRGQPAAPPRGARSVHLTYTAPSAATFYNEVTVEESTRGTYFMVCGFDRGYFGIQDFGGEKPKVILFSVWDASTGPASGRRVEVLYHTDDVLARRFGGEGTGEQSFFNYDWKLGQRYKFLVRATVDGTRTAFAAYFFLNETGAWKHLATFRTETGGSLLAGLYSFVEDFRRDGLSPRERRLARFGNGWVQPPDAAWQPLTEARFSADRTPLRNIDTGVREGDFFLATGGDIADHYPLGATVRIPPPRHGPPE